VVWTLGVAVPVQFDLSGAIDIVLGIVIGGPPLTVLIGGRRIPAWLATWSGRFRRQRIAVGLLYVALGCGRIATSGGTGGIDWVYDIAAAGVLAWFIAIGVTEGRRRRQGRARRALG
jgi:hypothetical protein